MTTRIVIAVEDASGEQAKVAQHFGRAPYFASVELNDQGQIITIKISRNTGEHMGGTEYPHENLLALKPNCIIAYGIGPGGLNSFHNAGINVLKAEGNTVKDVIQHFTDDKLEPLTTGCEHAHEHHPEQHQLH